MKAVVKYGLEPKQAELRDIPVPEPGEGDVLIKVKAAGLCGSDLHHYNGAFKHAIVPVVLGHEFAGVVAKAGSRVKRFKEGDRVVSDNTGAVCGVCYACSRGDYLQCMERKGLGSKMDGGFAEYVLISEKVLGPFPNSLMHIPDCLSFEEGAILDPFANGYNALIQQGGLMPGDSIAVTGAGPLALGCINVAKAAGAADILVLVRPSCSQIHRQAALKLGATEILELGKDDIPGRVKKITDNEGLALTADSAGAVELFPLCVDITRRGGKILRIGYDWKGLDYILNDMTNRNISLVGHMGYNPVAWKQVLALFKKGMLDAKSTITTTMPLDDFEKGVRLMTERKVVKLVFIP